MLDHSWLSPTPYLQRRSTSSGSWSETSSDRGCGGPRSRRGAHHVENIARRLVPLTSASCKEDGSDWREMSGDVRLLPSISRQPPIGASLHAAQLRTFALRAIARVNHEVCEHHPFLTVAGRDSTSAVQIELLQVRQADQRPRAPRRARHPLARSSRAAPACNARLADARALRRAFPAFDFSATHVAWPTRP